MGVQWVLKSGGECDILQNRPIKQTNGD